MKEVKVYSYNRISSTRQKKGFGLQRQREFAEEFARKHGLELDDSVRLEDPGRSAFHGEHRRKGILGDFLKAIESGEIARGSVLVVEDLDRLSRQNPWDAQDQLSGILRAGLRVVTSRDGQEYSLESDDNPIAPVIASLKIFLAYDESKKKSVRLKATWKKKRDIISDKKLTALCPSWLKLLKDRKTFEVLPWAAETISRVFELKLSGWSSRRIAETLNKDHLKDPKKVWSPPRKHKKQQMEGWRDSFVEKLLHNPAVIGHFQPSRLSTSEDAGTNKRLVPEGEVIQDYFPAVVDAGLFYRVQQRFQENTTRRKGEGKGGRTSTVHNLFSYIAKCGYCGKPMAIVPKGSGPKGGSYLLCDDARQGRGCVKAYVPYGERLRNPGLENVILEYCRDLDAKSIMDEEGDRRKAEIEQKMGELAAHKSELVTSEPAIERLMDDAQKQTDERVRDRIYRRVGEIENGVDFLKRRIEELKQEIDSLSRIEQDTQERLDSVKKLIEFFGSTSDEKDDPKRIEVRLKLREEIRRLIARIDVYPLGRPLFTPEKAERALQDMALVCPKGTNEYAQIKEKLRLRVEKAKDFMTMIVHFTNGSKRSLHPRQKPILTTEWDQEAGVLRGWYLTPDGQVEREEYGRVNETVPDV